MYFHDYFDGREAIVQSEIIKQKNAFHYMEKFIAQPWFGNAIEK